MTIYLYAQIVLLLTSVGLMLAHRYEMLGFKLAFLGFALCLFCVFLAGVMALFYQIFGSVSGRPSVFLAVLVLGVLPVVGILFTVGKKGLGVPPIHNITTNIANPPAFSEAYTLRTDAENSLDPLTGDPLKQHQSYYFELTTKITTLAPDAAFNRAVQLAKSLGWVIYNTQPQQGFFEAYDQTALFGFKDDIVVRVNAHSSGATLDLRSVSRVGKSDLGANAKRIKQFYEQFDQQ